MTRSVLETTSAECNSRFSYEELRAMLSVSYEEETSMLRVTVAGEEVDAVYETAQSVGKVFPEYIREITNDAAVDCYFGELTVS